uniref:Uncharacterized protein n=1 Tax=Arundo donax TaxID=35708 RepID=A0A0A9BEF4_ARUDO
MDGLIFLVNMVAYSEFMISTDINRCQSLTVISTC